MHFATLFTAVTLLAQVAVPATGASSKQHPVEDLEELVHQNEVDHVDSKKMEELAVKARVLVHSNNLNIVGTSLDEPLESKTLHQVPGTLEANWEYYADCMDDSDNKLTMLMFNFSQTYQRIKSSAKYSLGIKAMDRTFFSYTPYSPLKERRIALYGNFLQYNHNDTVLRRCMGLSHPDTRSWFPSNSISTYETYWMQFNISHIYYTDGMGENNFAGMMPVEFYRNATAFMFQPGYEDYDDPLHETNRFLYNYRKKWMDKVDEYESDDEFFQDADQDPRLRYSHGITTRLHRSNYPMFSSVVRIFHKFIPGYS